MIKHRAKSIGQRAQEIEHILSLRGEAEAISNEIACGVYLEPSDKILRPPLRTQNDRRRRSRNDILGVFSNEKGIALAMVLILSAIALAVMAGLIYMITAGTQISGMQKRYKTALEAGVGGADVAYQFISLRGDSTDTSSFLNIIKNLCPDPLDTTTCITTSGGVSGPGGCSGTDISGSTFYGLEAKLKTPSTSWSSACDKDNMSITPGITTSYDMRFDLGASPYPSYRVYTKIVDTVEGNSGVDEGLLGKGVVSAASGEVTVVSRPYLYTIEVDAENQANPSERAKLSILYQY